jgi:hypothetical protein
MGTKARDTKEMKQLTAGIATIVLRTPQQQYETYGDVDPLS